MNKELKQAIFHVLNSDGYFNRYQSASEIVEELMRRVPEFEAHDTKIITPIVLGWLFLQNNR